MTEISSAIFRAYDIRGIVGDALTADSVRLIGEAIGSEAIQIGQRTLVVGRDGRLSSPELSAALIGGLNAAGANVIDVGLVPTPVLYFAAYHLDAGSGVMLTGSHNPAEYNGLKIVLDGVTLSEAAIQALRRRIEEDDFESGQGSCEAVDVQPDYIARITGDVHLARPLKVAVDAGNGAAGEIAPRLFRALGCEVIERYCDIDGRFPNHHPDPTVPENLADLQRTVREEGADVGVAFDGDGDRVGVVASNGDIVWSDRLMMLLARDVLTRWPGASIIFDVKCSRHLAAAIEAAGGEPCMWKTGHSLIKARMQASGAPLAGEMSGHIFYKDRWYGFDDGVYTAARLLELLARDDRPSADVFAELPNAVSTPELRVDLPEGRPVTFMAELAERAAFDGGTVNRTDGLRVDYPDGWGLVRASNTTPSLVLRFEADSDAALARVQAAFRAQLCAVDGTLSLPF